MRVVTAVMLLALAPLGIAAQEGVPIDDEAIHDVLRALRDDVMQAVNDHDIDAVMGYLHPEIVFSTMDAEVCRGYEEVRAYYARKMTGPDKIVEDVTYDLTVDTLSILHGSDTAVAYGSSADHYELTDGMEFDVTTRWSATLVLENGRWLIASFQHGTSPFDNPVLDATKSWLLKIGIGGLLLGLIGGVVVGRISKRGRG